MLLVHDWDCWSEFPEAFLSHGKGESTSRINLPHDTREEKLKTKKWIEPIFVLDSLK
jgi:hypothetical protein